MKRSRDSPVGISEPDKRPRTTRDASAAAYGRTSATALAQALAACETMPAADIDAALTDFVAVQQELPVADQQRVVLAVLRCMTVKRINWQRLYNVIMGIVGYGSDVMAEHKPFIAAMMANSVGYEPLSFLTAVFGEALKKDLGRLLPDAEDLYDTDNAGFRSPYMLNNANASGWFEQLLALGGEDQQQMDYLTQMLITEDGVVPLPMLLANSRYALLQNMGRILEYTPVDQVPYILRVAAQKLAPTEVEVKALLDVQLSVVGRREVDIPFLSIFADHILGTRTLYFYTLMTALEDGRTDMVKWMLREQPDRSMFGDKFFLQLREKFPEVMRMARETVPLQYLVPRTLGRLRNIQRRKYRERITRGDLVYRWEAICAGDTDADEEELLGYAVGITLILNDLKGVGGAEANIAKRLTEEFQGAGTSFRRAACKYIAELTDEYRALVATMDCPLLSEERVQDIPLGQLITWVEGSGDGQRYCFTADEVAQLDTNPYTRGPLPEGAKAQAARYQREYGNWQYDRNEGARQEFMRDTKVYSDLWDMLNTGYPVSQSAYKALNRQQVMELDRDLRIGGSGFSRGAALQPQIRDSPDPHLALADKLVKFLGGPEDADFGSKVLLVNELLSDSTQPESVGVGDMEE